MISKDIKFQKIAEEEYDTIIRLVQNTDMAHTLGKDGEDETARVLTSLGLKVVRDIYISDRNNKPNQIDMVAISDKGVFVIENKNYSGAVKGKSIYLYWDVEYDNCKKQMLNPVKQNENHIEALWYLLRQNGIYIKPEELHNIVIFNSGVDLQTDATEVYMLDDFPTYYQGIKASGVVSQSQVIQDTIYRLLKLHSDSSDEAADRHKKALADWKKQEIKSLIKTILRS